MNVELGGFGGLSNNIPVFENSHLGKCQGSSNVWATTTSTQDIGMLTRLKRMTAYDGKEQKTPRFTVAAIRGALTVALELPRVSHVKLPLRRCRATGGCGATLAGVALHCATKVRV